MKVRFYSEKQRHPDRDNGARVPYGPARKRLPQLRWWLILLVVFSPLIYFGWRLVQNAALIEAPGNITFPSREYRATTGAAVQSIAVNVNERVEPGDLLVQLQDASLNQAIRDVQSQLSQLNNDTEVQRGNRPSLDFLNVRIEQAEKSVANRRDYLQSIERLLEVGAATRSEQMAAEQALIDARTRLATLQEEWQIQQDRNQAEQLSDSVATVQRSRTRVDLRERLERLTAERDQLRKISVEPGQVIDIPIVEGEAVGPGTALIEVGDRSQLKVRSFLDAGDLDYAKLGEKATVILSRGRSFRAEIVQVPNTAGRIPSEFAGPFGDRPSGIIVILAPIEAIPESWSIKDLPVRVRLDRQWPFLSSWLDSRGEADTRSEP